MHDSISSADLAAADASEARRRANDLTMRVEWLEGVIRAAGIQVDDVAVKAAMNDIHAERDALRKAEWERNYQRDRDRAMMIWGKAPTLRLRY